MSNFFDLFELDMQSVLVDEIDKSFSALQETELSLENIEKLKAYENANPKIKKGLYALYHNGVECYFGKSDKTLSNRLRDHYVKLSARRNISIVEMTFKCVYFDRNWSALSHEQPLIDKAKAGGRCEWNNRGFWNHDPGRERDSTQLSEDHFDRRFPIDPDYLPGLSCGPSTSLDSLLTELKGILPYRLRHASMGQTNETIELTGNETVKDILGKVVDKLWSDWQLTFLYWYVIMYKEHRRYPCQCYKLGWHEWIQDTGSY